MTGHRCEPVYTVTGMGIDFYEWGSLGACSRSHVLCAMGIFVSPIINVKILISSLKSSDG